VNFLAQVLQQYRRQDVAYATLPEPPASLSGTTKRQVHRLQFVRGLAASMAAWVGSGFCVRTSGLSTEAAALLRATAGGVVVSVIA